MFLLIFFLLCLFISLGVGALASYSDLRGMTIPNSYSGVIIAIFFVAWIGLYLGGKALVIGPLPSHLLSGAFIFGVTVVLFSMGLIGAADSKLATAYALWFSVSDLPAFLFYMTLIGGILGIAALVIQRRKPFVAPAENSWIYQVQHGANKVPYGVAIVVGAFIGFYMAGYFSPDQLNAFLLQIPTNGDL